VAAAAFVTWLLGEEAQWLIADFGVARNGQPHFVPRAPGWSRTPTA
ncbi:MAG: tungsten ABC transporter substrate-binding protein, partial [Chloroflexi bacterium]|nr:tungsten ABC transporter substrate-binding protein [Chloroflexota bacterium]